MLLKDRQIQLTERHKRPTTEEMKNRIYCRWNHSRDPDKKICIILRKVKQGAIQGGPSKFVGKGPEKMDVDEDPFLVNVGDRRKWIMPSYREKYTIPNKGGCSYLHCKTWRDWYPPNTNGHGGGPSEECLLKALLSKCSSRASWKPRWWRKVLVVNQNANVPSRMVKINYRSTCGWVVQGKARPKRTTGLTKTQKRKMQRKLAMMKKKKSAKAN